MNEIFKKFNLPIIGGMSFFTTLAVAISCDITFVNMINILFFALFFMFYKAAVAFAEKRDFKTADRVCVIIPAILFSFFAVFGRSFQETDSWDLVFASKTNILAAFLSGIGFFILFYFLILIVYAKFDDFNVKSVAKKSAKKNIFSMYIALLYSHPFKTAMITMFITYIPYIIFNYPALFMGDDPSILVQGYNLTDDTARYLNLVDENVKWNNHHPVAFTALLHLYMRLGETLSLSYNFSIFLFALTQFLFSLSVISLLIKTLVSLDINKKVTFCSLAYYTYSLRIRSYMFLVSKDIFYAAFMLLFLITGVHIILEKQPVKMRNWVVLFVSAIGTSLFRNDGKMYIIVALIVLIIVLKGKRKALIKCSSLVFAVMILYFNVLMPVLHVTPSSKREVLSIPFQQTARYVRDVGDEVTEDEKAAIDKILDYDLLAENYNPRLSDDVKETYNEKATSEDLKNYFKVWFQMLLKHPTIYVQATMNNYFGYFYPGADRAKIYTFKKSQRCMKSTNRRYPEIVDFKFSRPKALKDARLKYELIRNKIYGLPVLAVFESPALYTWTIILLVFYLIRRKKFKKSGSYFAIVIPLTSMLICLMAPTNGPHFRYLYPVAVVLPAVIVFINYILRSEESACDESKLISDNNSNQSENKN